MEISKKTYSLSLQNLQQHVGASFPYLSESVGWVAFRWSLSQTAPSGTFLRMYSYSETTDTKTALGSSSAVDNAAGYGYQNYSAISNVGTNTWWTKVLDQIVTIEFTKPTGTPEWPTINLSTWPITFGWNYMMQTYWESIFFANYPWQDSTAGAYTSDLLSHSGISGVTNIFKYRLKMSTTDIFADIFSKPLQFRIKISTFYDTNWVGSNQFYRLDITRRQNSSQTQQQFLVLPTDVTWIGPGMTITFNSIYTLGEIKSSEMILHFDRWQSGAYTTQIGLPLTYVHRLFCEAAITAASSGSVATSVPITCSSGTSNSAVIQIEAVPILEYGNFQTQFIPTVGSTVSYQLGMVIDGITNEYNLPLLLGAELVINAVKGSTTYCFKQAIQSPSLLYFSTSPDGSQEPANILFSKLGIEFLLEKRIHFFNYLVSGTCRSGIIFSPVELSVSIITQLLAQADANQNVVQYSQTQILIPIGGRSRNSNGLSYRLFVKKIIGTVTPPPVVVPVDPLPNPPVVDPVPPTVPDVPAIPGPDPYDPQADHAQQGELFVNKDAIVTQLQELIANKKRYSRFLVPGNENPRKPFTKPAANLKEFQQEDGSRLQEIGNMQVQMYKSLLKQSKETRKKHGEGSVESYLQNVEKVDSGQLRRIQNLFGPELMKTPVNKFFTPQKAADASVYTGVKSPINRKYTLNEIDQMTQFEPKVRKMVSHFLDNVEYPSKAESDLKFILDRESLYKKHNLPYDPFNSTDGMVYNLGFGSVWGFSLWDLGQMRNPDRLQGDPQFDLRRYGIDDSMWDRAYLKNPIPKVPEGPSIIEKTVETVSNIASATYDVIVDNSFYILTALGGALLYNQRSNILRLKPYAASAILGIFLQFVKSPDLLYSMYDRFLYGEGISEKLYKKATGQDLGLLTGFASQVAEDKLVKDKYRGIQLLAEGYSVYDPTFKDYVSPENIRNAAKTASIISEIMNPAVQMGFIGLMGYSAYQRPGVQKSIDTIQATPEKVAANVQNFKKTVIVIQRDAMQSKNDFRDFLANKLDDSLGYTAKAKTIAQEIAFQAIEELTDKQQDVKSAVKEATQDWQEKFRNTVRSLNQVVRKNKKGINSALTVSALVGGTAAVYKAQQMISSRNIPSDVTGDVVPDAYDIDETKIPHVDKLRVVANIIEQQQAYGSVPEEISSLINGSKTTTVHGRMQYIHAFSNMVGNMPRFVNISSSSESKIVVSSLSAYLKQMMFYQALNYNEHGFLLFKLFKSLLDPENHVEHEIRDAFASYSATRSIFDAKSAISFTAKNKIEMIQSIAENQDQLTEFVERIVSQQGDSHHVAFNGQWTANNRPSRPSYSLPKLPENPQGPFLSRKKRTKKAYLKASDSSKLPFLSVQSNNQRDLLFENQQRRFK